MRASNQLAPQKKSKQPFSVAIRGDTLQGLIKASVPDAADAARLTGTLISAVASNEQLKNCNPASVVAAALRGEGMKLTYGQDYHLVPYGEKCQYIVSYKGLLHLLIATGEVEDTNCVKVVEGEYKGRNKKTKRPEFDFSVYDSPEEEAEHDVLGWYFYVELRNGYTASEYMRIGDILNHAQRYSKTFDRAKYDAIFNGLGNYTPQEIERIKSSSPWYSSFETMAAKTVIRKLLNSGFVPLANTAELRRALDEDGESGEGSIISGEILSGINGETVSVVESTGEVIDVEAEDVPQEGVEAEPVPDMEEVEKPAPTKRGRKKKEPEPAAEPYDDYEDSFFGEV